jgi:hypothetical protein
MQEEETKREARKKKAADTATKKAANNTATQITMQTPRRNLFPDSAAKTLQKDDATVSTLLKQQTTSTPSNIKSRGEQNSKNKKDIVEQTESQQKDPVTQSRMKKQENGDRNDLMRSIKQVKFKTRNQIEPKGKNALHQELEKRSAQISNIRPQVNHDSDGVSLDPRQALMRSIKQGRSYDDKSSIETPFLADDSNRLMKSIIDRKTGERNNDNSTKSNIQEGTGDDLESVAESSVMRSSRSLTCGIVPDWEMAVSTFDPL